MLAVACTCWLTQQRACYRQTEFLVSLGLVSKQVAVAQMDKVACLLSKSSLHTCFHETKHLLQELGC